MFNDFYRYAELRSVHRSFDVCVSGSSTAQTDPACKRRIYKNKEKGVKKSARRDNIAIVEEVGSEAKKASAINGRPHVC